MTKILKGKKYSVLILLLSLLFPFALVAQQTISGKVTDTDLFPLDGVTVNLKTTGHSTKTNKEGIYSFSGVISTVGTLVFSHIGFVKKEVPVNPNTGIYNIQMVKQENELDNVVVVGYGTTRRRDLTGAVGNVKMNDLAKAPVASFEDALAGRVAGVQVTSVDGQPGSNNQIVIRGGNSITQSNTPLYVIDGFPIEIPDNNAINPEEIESIEILKDASSTAIYGARGANGVIMITTKKGKLSVPVVTYNGWYGFQKNIKQQEVMSAYEFVKYQLELSPTIYTPVYFNNGKTLESYRNVPGINWQNEILRTAPMQNHALSLRGGNDKTRYSLSGSVVDQKGIIINGGFKRYQGRITIDQTINSRVKAGVTTNYSYTSTYGQIARTGFDNVGNPSTYLFYSAWGYRPVTGNDVNDASFLDDPFDLGLSSVDDLRINPLQGAKNKYNKTFANTLLANAYIEYNFLNDFNLRITGGITQNTRKNEVFNNSKTPAGSPVTVYGALNGINGSITNFNNNSWLNENTLTYKKRLNDHSLEVLGGFTLQQNVVNVNGFTSTLIPNEALGIINRLDI